ncbi:MAG: hypothetical protein HC895_00725 [Leptolyngbyaceae cyanobacterium SM1_3_5]|nr:hypothetical protein [Leptolyngbyaceae cyanobacterium SM1_3_5]
MSKLAVNTIRRAVIVLLCTLTVLFAPVLTAAALADSQGVGLPLIEADQDTPDKGTIECIQQKAEDFGDSEERPIGETGLENIRELAKKIPETIELNARQKGAINNPKVDDKIGAMDKGQAETERNAR